MSRTSGFIVVALLRDGFVSRGVSPTVVAALVAIGIAMLVVGATLGPARHARNTEPAPLAQGRVKPRLPRSRPAAVLRQMIASVIRSGAKVG